MFAIPPIPVRIVRNFHRECVEIRAEADSNQIMWAQPVRGLKAGLPVKLDFGDGEIVLEPHVRYRAVFHQRIGINGLAFNLSDVEPIFGRGA